MSDTAYNAITIFLIVAMFIALAIAFVSFVGMIFRWKTPLRRGHVIRLISSLVAVPCLITIQQGLLWFVYLPALGRQQMVEINAVRAAQLAESSFVAVGDPAPDFTITDADGRTFSMTDAKGSVVMLTFFATWCGPCKRELPHIDRIWGNIGGTDNFQLLVIGRDESMDSVRDFRATHNFSFPIAPDPEGKIFSMFAKKSIPRTLIVSPDGLIVYSLLGFLEEDLSELKAVLSDQLARQH